MNPIKFDQANSRFGPPDGIAESQVGTIHAYEGTIDGGSMDGVKIIITAWQPTAEELQQLNAGQPVFISFAGGWLPPHFASTSFESAKAPQ